METARHVLARVDELTRSGDGEGTPALISAKRGPARRGLGAAARDAML
jgi:hypothetical protein